MFDPRVGEKVQQAMAIRVLIADDHEVVRSGLKSLLQGPQVEVVGEAATGREAVDKVVRLQPDIVILDVRMPDGDGLATLGRIKLECPELPVLMLSTFDNPTYVARSVALGACGYVLKTTPRERLIDSVTRGAQGESVWTREELRKATGSLSAPRLASDLDVQLTQRESEVLLQLALGLTNKEIANALEISYETVKEHVQHILRKVGVSDRTQAAVWAVRKGLV